MLMFTWWLLGEVLYLHQYQHVNNASARLFTLTLSKLSGQVEDARRPSLFSFLQISSPSVSWSTMKQVMPLYPCQSTRAELFLFIAKQFLMRVEMRYFYIKIQLQKYEKWVMTGHKKQKNLGYSQQTGPHWPSPGKHRRALRC